MNALVNDIDQYISSFPAEIQKILTQVRMTIKEVVPDAEEVISYGMPAFKQNGMLVWYAAFKNHIGFYPVPSGMKAFNNELSVFKQGKGSVQFPLDKPMPLELISNIVKFRVAENTQKANAKKKTLN